MFKSHKNVPGVGGVFRNIHRDFRSGRKVWPVVRIVVNAFSGTSKRKKYIYAGTEKGENAVQ